VPRLLLLALSLAGTFLLFSPYSPVAVASQSIARDAASPTLQVDAAGRALVRFGTRGGSPRSVVASGAVDAAGSSQPEVRFQLDYRGAKRAARGFRDRCGSYTGPPLPLLVVACTAPDGSHWALQQWQRVLPLRGLEPFKPEHGAHELHLSHWSGALPELEVSPNWTYGGRWQGLFGRLTYRQVPVHGTRTPSARVADGHARYVYIDTLNSAYGPGWRRDAAKVTHRGNGAFCYSFVPQPPPPGYPPFGVRGPGNGERHRVTAMGPGVTPVVQWEGAALQRYDAAADSGFDAAFDRLVGSADGVCRSER
jgi:hypothetical protein